MENVLAGTDDFSFSVTGKGGRACFWVLMMAWWMTDGAGDQWKDPLNS